MSKFGSYVSRNLATAKIYKDKEGESGLACGVVMDFMRVYLDQNLLFICWHLLHLSETFSYLKKQNTFASGTIRSNCGQFPDKFKNAKLSRGKCIYLNSPLNTGSLLAMHWYDKRDVFVLSTIHGTGSVEVRR